MDNKNKWQVWFDLDGVMADFEGELYKSEEVRKAKEILDKLILRSYPEYAGLKPDELKARIKEDSKTNPDIKPLKATFYKYQGFVYKMAGSKGFFASLDLLPGAYEMLEQATKITGQKPNVCTAPMGDENDPENHSVIEKKAWVKKHFGDKVNHIEVTLNKGKVVTGLHDILIDDRQKYLDSFISAGGKGIKHETPSASNMDSWKKSMQELEKICLTKESNLATKFEDFIKL